MNVRHMDVLVLEDPAALASHLAARGLSASAAAPKAQLFKRCWERLAALSGPAADVSLADQHAPGAVRWGVVHHRRDGPLQRLAEWRPPQLRRAASSGNELQRVFRLLLQLALHE